MQNPHNLNMKADEDHILKPIKFHVDRKPPQMSITKKAREFNDKYKNQDGNDITPIYQPKGIGDKIIVKIIYRQILTFKRFLTNYELYN